VTVRNRARGSARAPGVEEGAASLQQPFDEVLHAARRGDDAAWAALYRDLAPALVGYLRGRGAPDPEDLVGEVWVQVVRHIDGFEGDERGFRSWVFTIAHRRLIDVRRVQRRRPEDLSTVQDLEFALPPVEAEPEALATLGTQEVLALLDLLTDDQREVLLLRLVAGLRLAEIAEVTGRPRQAVKSLQKRGIEHLRRLVAP
jgi:RNA polymerase sigma factor (sigma-70 family)